MHNDIGSSNMGSNNMDSNGTCFHCTEKLTANLPVSAEINGITCHFCCSACLAITNSIYASGLDDYYRQRNSKAGKTPRHDFTAWDRHDAEDGFVENDGDCCTAKFYIEGLHCTSCAWLIEKHLMKQAGIFSAQLNFQQQVLIASWRRNTKNVSEVMNAIADIGYLPHPFHANTVKDLQQKEAASLLKQIGITAILMMQIGMFSIGIYAGDFVGISAEYRNLLGMFSLLFSIPLLYFSARPFFTAALLKIRNGQPGIDVSISIAIIGLYGSSVYSVIRQTGEFYFDSIAMFCLFILIARFIEKKSRMSLLQPNALLPDMATRIQNGEYETVPASSLQAGDTVLVRQGDTIAVDGRVLAGNSSVNEAFLNGEARPVRKMPDDMVYAGSINHDGELTITVINTGLDTFVKRIEQLSQQAAQEKPQQQNLTDHIAARFTITVYLLAIGTFLYWHMQGNASAFWIALSVLVISCPCALSLAAPTALSTVQYTLRNSGILIQSAHVIEKLHSITCVLFDKTGTLTKGCYGIMKTVITGNTGQQQCLAIAHALEATSRHPIAQAFSEKGLQASDIHIHAHLGIEGVIDHIAYRIGNSAFCQGWHNSATAPDTGGQWLGLCNKQEFLAWFLLDDELRDDAPGLVRFLKKKGMKTCILSGDHSDAVDKVARQLDITDFQKSCTSGDKLSAVQALQAQGQRCLMTGDGINDAPVLSQSDISVTLLNACDWVKNSTDIILLNNRLGSLADVFHHASRYRMIVWQNFAWALFYNSITIPFAMAGLVTPYWAAIGMSLSSVAVVINSRRLKKQS